MFLIMHHLALPSIVPMEDGYDPELTDKASILQDFGSYTIREIASIRLLNVGISMIYDPIYTRCTVIHTPVRHPTPVRHFPFTEMKARVWCLRLPSIARAYISIKSRRRSGVGWRIGV